MICSVRARESRWERPLITMAADLSVRGFHVGDSVEVYSNSAEVSDVGIGWEGCGTHHYHWFPVSTCENALMGDERVVLNVEDLRKPEQGMVNTSPLLAAKHLTWVPEESAVRTVLRGQG